MESPEVKGEPTPLVSPAATPAADAPQSTTALLVTVAIAAIVGVAGLAFAVVGTRATAAAVSPPGVPAPVAAGTSPHGPTVQSAALSTPGWSHAHAYRWVSNHPRSAAFELESLEQVPVWTTKVRPMLVVRCLAKRTEVFVYTETAARIESEDENHTVRLAFDGDQESVERWPDSEEHDALFAPDSTMLTARIASGHHLKFTFTPHNAQPVTVNFDLQGADAVVLSVRKTCGVR